MVTEERCVRRGDHQVFSTPAMVAFLESTAVLALKPYLNSHQASVGMRVEVRHLAPTPKGMHVRAVASVSAVDRRRVTFHVDIFDEVEKVGEAEHDRFIVDIDTFGARLAEKLALLGGS